MMTLSHFTSVCRRRFHLLPCAVAIWLLSACGSGESGSAPVAGSDSIYTTTYVQQIHMSQPQRALGLIDTMEIRKLIKPHLANFLRCTIYQNTLEQPRIAIYYAIQATEDPLCKKESPVQYCTLTNLLSEREYRTNHFSKSLTYAKHGLETARQNGLKMQELNFTFAIGRNMVASGDEEEGLKLMQQVIEEDETFLSEPKTPQEADHKIYVAGEVLELFLRKGKYAEAEALIPYLEKVLTQVATTPGLPDGYLSMRQMEIYSNIMRLYDEMKDFKKSETYLAKVLKCNVQRAIAMNRTGGHYLATGQYHKLLENTNNLRDYFHQNFDSISYDYLNGVLHRQLAAHVALGNERQARVTAQQIIAIKDSLNLRAQEGDAAQLSKIYETQEKERRLTEQQQQLDRQHTLLMGSALVLVLAFALIGVMVYYTRKINRRSRATVNAIQQLIEPTSEAMQNESASKVMEDMRLRQAANLFKSHPEMEPEEVMTHCGMEGMENFCKRFEERFGLHPVEYRKWSAKLKQEKETLSRNAQEKEQEAQQMKQNFIQNMSHEIRTPLNQISGFVQMLTDPTLTLGDDEKRQMNDIIAGQTRNMTEILNTFLEVSEYDSSDQPLPTEEVAIDTVMEAVGEATHKPQPGVELTCENLSGMDTLQTNAKGLIRLLLCLTDNAVKFTEQGTIRVTCGRDEADDKLFFSVADTGIGVRQGEEEKIFERFYKVDEFVPGIGIGLSLARQIATRLEGTLTLDRTYSPGARFILKLG